MGRIKRRETEVRARLGDEDLILSQMTSGSVVFAVRNPPGVVWNPETDGKLVHPVE